MARVVSLVAEQTGYPAELLDLDLDLEADLGIDTVKQAELFAQIRETYGIEREDQLKLRDYPTLNHVVGFVRDRLPQTTATPAPTAPAAPAPTTADPTSAAAPPSMLSEFSTTFVQKSDVLPVAVESAAADDAAAAGFPRRVAVPVVRPPLEWFAPTGIRLEAGSRVVVLPDTGGVAAALSAALAARGVEVLVADTAVDNRLVAEQFDRLLADGPIHGLYALAALDNEGPLADLDVDDWQDGVRRRVKVLALATRAIYDRMETAGMFVVTATRNGGVHGYDEVGAHSAMAGAVSGFTKALAKERPAALVKVIDVEVDASPDEVASALVDETLRDAGAVEIGRQGSVRFTIGLQERAAISADPARALGPDSVVVATGAAGSIVSAIVADLARAAGGGTFHLLDLIPEPDPADPDLAKFTTDRDAAEARPGRPHRGEGSAGDTGADRAGAGSDRAPPRRAGDDRRDRRRRRPRPLVRRRPTRRRGGGERRGRDPSAQPARGCASPCRRAGDQPLPPGEVDG